MSNFNPRNSSVVDFKTPPSSVTGSNRNGTRDEPEPPEALRSYGKVKFFSQTKGWGFIEPERPFEDRKDIFFHISQLEKIGLKTIAQGQKVSYHVKQYAGTKRQAVFLRTE